MRVPSRWAWPAAAAIVPVLIATAYLGHGRTLAWRDTARILAPVRPFVVDALRHGRLPLWNPYVGAGAPLFADAIHGVLHPLSLLSALVSDGVDVLILMYLAAAGLGAWLAARSFGASPAAAAAAGIGYGASGAVLATTSLVQCMSGAATIPWVIAAARGVGIGTRHAMPMLALATGAMVLGGDLQGTVIAAGAALLVAAEGGGTRAAGRAAATVALGLLVGSVQLLPTWSIMQRSLRVYDFDPTTAHQWALQPWRLLELVVPGLVGGRPGPTHVAAFVALEPEGRFSLPFLSSVLVGLPIAVAAVAGVRTRTGRVLAATAGVLLWLALGHRLGAQQALSWVPIWKSFRYAEKLVPYLSLLVAVLASIGVEAIATSPADRRRATWAVLGFALASALGVEAFIRTLPPRVASPDAALQVAANASAGLAAFAVVALATGAWLLLSGRWPRATVTAFVALVTLHAAATSRFALLAIPDFGRERPPALAAPPPGPRLATPRIFDPRNGLDPGATADFHSLESAGGALNYNVRSRIDNIDVTGALISRRFELLWTELGSDRWFAYRRYGVTHVALPRWFEPANLKVAKRSAEGGTIADQTDRLLFYAVPHRPWASFAEAVRPVASPIDTLRATREAILASSPAVVLEGTDAPAVAHGRILAIERRPERVTIDAEADGDGLLVVNDAFFPGWSAKIDGAPARIIPADVLVRAVPFPAGRHRLEMTYSPREVPIGAALTGLGLAGVLALWLFERRRNRR
jgi:hypothetical protein